MKNKICFCLLFTVLFLCGCTENTNITVSSENKVYETFSTEETVSLVTEKTTATTANNHSSKQSPQGLCFFIARFYNTIYSKLIF